MRDIKKQGTCFIDAEDEKSLMCAFDRNQDVLRCNTDCVACEISQDSMQTTVACLRGSFTFGKIIK